MILRTAVPSGFTDAELLTALETHRWNISRAADDLAVGRESLRVAAVARFPKQYAAKRADGTIRVGNPVGRP